MSGGKKRQTMAKQARERAVREKRALKQERKREAAHLRLAGEAEPSDVPADEDAEQGLRLVADEGSAPPEATADVEPRADSVEPAADSVERDEGELRGAHA